LIKAIQMLTASLRNQVANTVTRAIVQLVDDSRKFQALQVEMLAGEVRENVERVQNYGFTSVPLPPDEDGVGPEAVVVSVGGRRDHAVVIACDDRRYRIKGLVGGEVAVYTDQGDKIVLKRDGHMELTASTKVLVTCPLIELKASTKVLVTGKLDVTDTATIAGKLTVNNDVGITGDVVADGDLDCGKTVTAITDVVGGGKHLKTHTHGPGTFAITEAGSSGSVDPVSGASGAPS